MKAQISPSEATNSSAGSSSCWRSPDYAWTVAELLGDPDGKLKADASLGGMSTKDKEGLKTIWIRIMDIDALTEETGGTDALESEKDALLRDVEKYSARDRMEASVSKAYNNITTQKRQFLKKLMPEMPCLAAHLLACVIQTGNDYTISYKPPTGSPCWHVENPRPHKT